MKRSTIKNIFLIVLLISNSILLFMWINAPQHRRHGPRNQIIEKLDLSEKQVVQYDVYITEHRKSIRTLEDKLSQKKKALFHNVDKPFNDSIAEDISEIEKDILKVHYKHIQEIKSLCKGDQLEKFEKLNKEISQLFNAGRPKK